MPDFTLHRGDCLETMRGMADNSVDSIVTDPPYGLSFMGKKWDCDVPAVEVWAECLRVLKPGGHLLAFAGTRTQHRMAVRIEDAGFEIRDMIAWVYGSGFPKSLDVSKAIDRAAGKLAPEGQGFTVAGYSHNPDKLLHTAPSRGYVPPLPATPEAEQWQGWGTALKPALEPITMARKPFASTVAANVLEHGTGALNIDGCRVGYLPDERVQTFWNNRGSATINTAEGVGAAPKTGEGAYDPSKGRWPANLIHDGSDEVLAAFPETAPSKAANRGIQQRYDVSSPETARPKAGTDTARGHDDNGGSAARFFYCAKASKSDRGAGNTHPTVKPTDLMAYLVRLVTPPGGVVLDPFMGSGSTGKAAMREGFDFIGCELDDGYIEIARARIEHERVQGVAQAAAPLNRDLFTEAA